MAKKKQRHGLSRAQAIGLGVGVAAAAAAAAGMYFFAGKHGAKNRKQVKAWAHKAKKEVVAQLKKAKALNQKKYNQIVSEVSKRYSRVKNLDPKEVARLTKELQGYWKQIERVARARSRKPAKRRR